MSVAFFWTHKKEQKKNYSLIIEAWLGSACVLDAGVHVARRTPFVDQKPNAMYHVLLIIQWSVWWELAIIIAQQ